MSGNQVDTLSPELDRKYAKYWVDANHRKLLLTPFELLSEMAHDGLISRAAIRKAHEADIPLEPGQSRIMIGRVDDSVSTAASTDSSHTKPSKNAPSDPSEVA